ncbi:hypothetical protein KI387_034713, partial [Taxus chinensis]
MESPKGSTENDHSAPVGWKKKSQSMVGIKQALILSSNFIESGGLIVKTSNLSSFHVFLHILGLKRHNPSGVIQMGLAENR